MKETSVYETINEIDRLIGRLKGEEVDSDTESDSDTPLDPAQ